MENNEKPFEVSRSFGLGVLLKLTKKNSDGIEIFSNGEKFTSNVTMGTLKDAVNATMRTHNIKLKIK